MKKIICAILLVAALATLFVACGEEKFKCDICGEEKTGKKNTEEIAGEEITYCNDCVKDLADLGAEIGEELGDFEEEIGDLGDLFG